MCGQGWGASPLLKSIFQHFLLTRPRGWWLSCLAVACMSHCPGLQKNSLEQWASLNGSTCLPAARNAGRAWGPVRAQAWPPAPQAPQAPRPPAGTRARGNCSMSLTLTFPSVFLPPFSSK